MIEVDCTTLKTLIQCIKNEMEFQKVNKQMSHFPSATLPIMRLVNFGIIWGQAFWGHANLKHYFVTEIPVIETETRDNKVCMCYVRQKEKVGPAVKALE